MNIKRYKARSAREALRALKAELGADAIVLSNRAVEGGVEILALPAESVGSLQSAARHYEKKARAQESRPNSVAAPVSADAEESAEDADYTISLSSSSRMRETRRPARVISPFNPPRYDSEDQSSGKRNVLGWPEPESDLVKVQASVPRMQSGRTVPQNQGASRDRFPDKFAAAKTPEDDKRIETLQSDNARLMSELSGIRSMIERQLASFAWRDTRFSAPAKAELLGSLLESGFSVQLARELVESVSDQSTPEEARELVRATLARDLRAMSCDADLIDRGGVYALVGPTGVGKTTTTAKIAARCVVRHGADKLALITTDGYRIGAQEQLRIYGRILGIPVFPVRDASDLRQTLSELHDKHMILIDTVGMSQRDRMVAHQASMLLGAGPVKRLLLLNATARGDTLDDVVSAYGGPNLAGCILTKVDEAVSLAPAIGAAISHRLELRYVANGQRVPEDLHLPNRTYLLHRALRSVPNDSAWHMQPEEVGLMVAFGGASMSGV